MNPAIVAVRSRSSNASTSRNSIACAKSYRMLCSSSTFLRSFLPVLTVFTLSPCILASSNNSVSRVRSRAWMAFFSARSQLAVQGRAGVLAGHFLLPPTPFPGHGESLQHLSLRILVHSSHP